MASRNSRAVHFKGTVLVGVYEDDNSSTFFKFEDLKKEPSLSRRGRRRRRGNRGGKRHWRPRKTCAKNEEDVGTAQAGSDVTWDDSSPSKEDKERGTVELVEPPQVNSSMDISPPPFPLTQPTGTETRASH
jgi:hypothetical protein